MLGYVLFSIAGGITLGELQLHPWRRPLGHVDEAAEVSRSRFGAELENVEITASDGVSLNAWYLRPQHANGRDVLLLHGVRDNREGVAGFAPMLLDRGYSVLLPDARAHGESGGELATYGLRESDDIHHWVDWLYAKKQSKCVYGFGESMGAALVLDSLAVEDRFCAVVAESPFSTFRSVAYERAALYLRARHGLDGPCCACRWKRECCTRKSAMASISIPIVRWTPSGIHRHPFCLFMAQRTSTFSRTTRS